jgi:hypothetical protein
VRYAREWARAVLAEARAGRPRRRARASVEEKKSTVTRGKLEENGEILPQGIAFLRGVYVSSMMTPTQCRAARGLLEWSVGDLARAAGVSIITVRKFESGKGSGASARATVDLMRRALEGAGVRFSRSEGGEGGVRLASRAP